jgi:hypothetical protein
VPAENANLAAWKMNEGKSRFGAGAPKADRVVCEASGDDVKVTIDGASPDGKPTHSEWTGKFDGREYPVSGDPNQAARAYTKVNDHTMKVQIKLAKRSP